MYSRRLAIVVQIALVLFVPALILSLHPYTPNPAADIKLLLTGCCAALGLFFLAGLLLRNHPADLIWPPLTALLLAWSGLQFITAWVSLYPENSLVHAARFLALVALFVVAAFMYHRPRHFRWLALVACTGVAIAALYGLLQKVGWDPFPWDESHRRTSEYAQLPSTFGNPNLAGHVLVLAIIVNLYLVMQRGAWRWSIVFLPLMLLHFYFTGLRSGFVALGAVLLLLGWMLLIRRLGLPRFRSTVMVLGLLGLSFVALAISGMLFWKWRTGDWLPLDSSLLLRYNALLSGARMLLEHPWLGWGPGNYSIENTPFWTSYEQLWYATEGRINRNVHNDLIEHGIHSGILGSFFYIAFFVCGIGIGLYAWFTEQSRELRNLGGLIACLFLAFVVDGQFGFNLHAPVSAALFFVLAGAGIGVLHRNVTSRYTGDRKSLMAPSRLALVLLLCVVAGSLLYWESRIFQGRLHQQSGRGAIEWEAYDAARDLLHAAEDAMPWSWEVPQDLGRAAFEEGAVEEAARHYERAMQRNPHHLKNLLELGRLRLSQGIVAKQEAAFAEETLDESVEAPSGESTTLYLQKATRLAERLVELCPPWSDANLLMAQCVLTSADYPIDGSVADIEDEAQEEAVQTARHYLEQALQEAQPGYRAQLLSMHARLCMSQHDYEAAGASIIRAVQANPGNDDTLLLYWEYSQNQDKMAAMLEELQSHQPRLERDLRENDKPWDEANLGWNLLYQARALAAMDQAAKAAPLFQEAGDYIAYEVRYWDYYTDFALAHDYVDPFKETLLQAVGELATRDMSIPGGVEALAIFWEQGARGLSSATNRLFVSIQEEHVQLRPSERAQHFAWAIRMLEHTMNELPRDFRETPWLQARFGAFYHGIGDYERAYAVFEENIREIPEDQQLILGFFWYESARAIEEPEAALEIARYMQGLAPGSWEWRLAEARVLAELERYDAARFIYETVLQQAPLDTEERESLQEEIDSLPA